MTYSITAFDRASGRWGVAVQSCVLVVGTRVPAVRSGAGALAVQAGSPSWLRRPGIEMLAHGASAEQVVAALTGLPRVTVGQFAVVDSAGRAAAHTGGECTAAAGHAIGDGVVAAANLVARAGMWDDMLHAYEAATGSFEERLLAALRAGESAGGDVRGRQSAALLVCAGQRDGDPVFETDLRVDDAAEPVEELARLVTVKAAHDELRRALPDAGAGHWAAAAERLAAVAGTAPGDALVTVWTGVALGLAGRVSDAEPYLRDAARQNKRLADYLAREPLLAGQWERDAALRLMRAATGELSGEAATGAPPSEGAH
jgi:uncharacterized Ntn-hydrolase superfamily protein